MYFYELHEGDDEIFEDLLLAHDELFEPDEFFEMVQRMRHRVQDGFTHDTLIEAVADALEREFGFSPIDDDELTASVHISVVEDENVLIATGRFAPEPEWGSDDEVEDAAEEGPVPVMEDLPDFVTITAEVKTDKGPRPH